MSSKATTSIHRGQGKLANGKETQTARRDELITLIQAKFVELYSDGANRKKRLIEGFVKNFFARNLITEINVEIARQKASNLQIAQKHLPSQPMQRTHQMPKLQAPMKNRQDNLKTMELSMPTHEEPEAITTFIQPPRNFNDFDSDEDDDDEDEDERKAEERAQRRLEQMQTYANRDQEKEWATLVAEDVKTYEMDQLKEFERQQRLKEYLREDLERQIEEKKAQQELEKTQEAVFDDMTRFQMKVFDEREAKKALERRNAQESERLSREAQIQKKANRKLQEEQQELQQDKLFIKRVRQETKLEQQAILDSKKKELERMKKDQETTKRNQQIALGEAMKEKQEEQEQLAAQLQAEEEKEQRRQAMTIEREAKLHAAMMEKVDISSFKDMKTLQKEEDARLVKHMKKMIELDALEVEQQQQEDRNLKRELRDALVKQMEDRIKMKAEDEKVEQLQKEFWARDVKAWEEEERAKNISKQKLIDANNAIILTQMKEKEKNYRWGPCGTLLSTK